MVNEFTMEMEREREREMDLHGFYYESRASFAFVALFGVGCIVVDLWVRAEVGTPIQRAPKPQPKASGQPFRPTVMNAMHIYMYSRTISRIIVICIHMCIHTHM